MSCLAVLVAMTVVCAIPPNASVTSLIVVCPCSKTTRIPALTIEMSSSRRGHCLYPAKYSSWCKQAKISISTIHQIVYWYNSIIIKHRGCLWIQKLIYRTVWSQTFNWLMNIRKNNSICIKELSVVIVLFWTADRFSEMDVNVKQHFFRSENGLSVAREELVVHRHTTF